MFFSAKKKRRRRKKERKKEKRENRSSHQRYSVRKVFLIQRKTPMPESLFFNKVETLAQVFSCECCEICKSTFFTVHLWTTISERKVNFNSECHYNVMD